MTDTLPVELRRAARVMPTLASGGVLWAFLVLVPTLHLGLFALMTPGHVALGVVPLLVLAWGALQSNRVASVLLFPTSALPLLLLYPELTGPRVYGLGAFLALAGATVAHLLVTLAPSRPPGLAPAAPDASQPGRRPARLLATATAVMGVVGLVPLLALHFDRDVRTRLATAYPDDPERATVFIALLLFGVWAVAVQRFLVTGLGRLLLDRTPALAQWYRFRIQATSSARVRSSLMWAAMVALLSGLLLALVLAAAERW